MTDVNVIPLHPLGNAEALAWLRGQPNGRIETTISDLARQFGWPRTKLRRRLTTWAGAGHITRGDGRKGKIVITAVPPPALDELSITFHPLDGTAPSPTDNAAEPAADSPAEAQGEPLIEAPAESPVESRALALPGVAPLPEPAPRHVRARARRPVVATITAMVLLVTGLGLAAVGLTMNARFAASFGQTPEAAILLAAIGLAIDVLAVLLPSVGAQLWHHGSRAAAVLAWSIWTVALTMTLLAASGFASTNIGDAVAGRAKIASENAVLAERIERLRAERAGITEARATAAIESELQQAQPGAQSVWKITDGCRDVTRARSGRACGTVLSLREELAVAQRRDAIDADLRDAQSKLAALPAIATADPQATTVAEIVAWLTDGHVNPSPRDIYWLRTLGLTITPSLAGLIAMLALTLAQARRPPEPSPAMA